MPRAGPPDPPRPTWRRLGQTRETLLGRRLWRWLGVALALLVLTGATGSPGILRLPSAWLNQGLAPIEVTVSLGVNAVSGLWSAVVGLWSLRRENAQLRSEVASLQAQARSAAELAAENTSLTALLHLQSSEAAAGRGSGIAAPVIGHSADNWWSVLVVGRGTRAGVRAGMAAVTASGDLVGEVEPGVGPTSARVMLVTNPEFGAGVEVQRAASRAQGVAVGQIGNPLLTVTFFSAAPNVHPGDVLVTSGVNIPGAPGGFPAGITVGTVTAVAPGSAALTRQAVAQPATQLDGVDLVLLLPAPASGGAP